MRKSHLLAWLTIPSLLDAAGLIFCFAVAYRVPIAPAADYSAELRALVESIHRAPSPIGPALTPIQKPTQP